MKALTWLSAFWDLSSLTPMRLFVFLVMLFFAPPAMAGGAWVDFMSAEGTVIRGWLATPPWKGPHPGVVMMHSCFGPVTKSDELATHDAAWVDILTKAGYVVLVADSYTPRGQGSLCQVRDRPVLARAERPWDAIGALQFLQEQSYVKADSIALMGWSNGAISLLWTVRNGASAATALDGPDFRTAVGFYPYCNDIQTQLPDYRPRIPVLLQIGDKDDWTLPEPCQLLVSETRSRGGDMMIDIYNGAFHLFDAPNTPLREFMAVGGSDESSMNRIHFGTNKIAREKAIQRTLNWLAERLR